MNTRDFPSIWQLQSVAWWLEGWIGDHGSRVRTRLVTHVFRISISECRDDRGHWFRSGSPLTNYQHASPTVLWSSLKQVEIF